MTKKTSKTDYQKVIEIISIKQVTAVREDLDRVTIQHPEDIVSLARNEIGDDDREIFLVVSLNIKNEINALHRCHVGSVDCSIVHPREIFKAAILNNAASVFVAHQHPSGNPEPSKEDFDVTKRLCKAGGILGIPVLDHVIVAHGTDRYTSFREERIISGNSLFNQAIGEEDELEF